MEDRFQGVIVFGVRGWRKRASFDKDLDSTCFLTIN